MCVAGNVALAGCGWPVAAANCFIDPSADIESTVSAGVHASPQMASEWAVKGKDEGVD